MLNAKQQRFVDEYLIDLNATAAYKRAGYAARGASADTNAGRLLRNAEIQALISKSTQNASALAGLTVERTLQELARLAYSDVRKLYGKDGVLLPIHELDDDTAAMVAGVDVTEITNGEEVLGRTKKIKVWDKNSALDKAMKYLRMVDSESTPIELNVNIGMDQNMLEAARRIAYVLARGSGRIINQKKT